MWQQAKSAINRQADAFGLVGWPSALDWKDPNGHDPSSKNGELGSVDANDLWSNRRALLHWNASTRHWTALALMEKRIAPGRFQLVSIEDVFGTPKLTPLLGSKDGGSDSTLSLEDHLPDEPRRAWISPRSR